MTTIEIGTMAALIPGAFILVCFGVFALLKRIGY